MKEMEENINESVNHKRNYYLPNGFRKFRLYKQGCRALVW